MPDPHLKTLTEIQALLASGEVKVQETVSACLDQIQATEPRINALLSVQAEQALETAKAMDAKGPDPDKPLWGVPLIIKDILATKGAPTTCASRMLENFVPFYDAHAVDQLKRAGAVLLAKANMDEFAMGSSTENSAFGPTRNPWDLNKVPGGSSGGSAASVAARQCFGALGTDTGGSIRLPACFCGCVGLKPTYGRVSRYGCVAYGSSLDQIGPLTRTAKDNAALLQVIAGFDEKDSTSVQTETPDYTAALAKQSDLKGLTIGLPEEYFGKGLSPEVEKACLGAVDMAQKLGAKTVPVSLKHAKYAVAAYYIIVMAEACSNLARYDGVRYGLRDKSATELIEMYVSSRTQGFGDEVQRRIIIGTYVLSAGYYDAYYRKAAQVRRLIRGDFVTAFEKCDVIFGPVCPTTAFPLGDKIDDPLQMYLIDIFTTSVNLAGLPGLSLPCGLGADTGMPVGLQIIGPAFGEPAVLRAACALEENMGPLPYPKGLG